MASKKRKKRSSRQSSRRRSSRSSGNQLGHSNTPMSWVRLRPLADCLTLGGGYLRSEDGRFVIFARRYQIGHKGSRRSVNEYKTIEYLNGATYATGGTNKTLYSGSNLTTAKGAAR